MPIDAILAEIEKSHFFSAMGKRTAQADDLIYVDTLREVFTAPTAASLKDGYPHVEWLPTSPTQHDPFYRLDTPDAALVERRLTVTRAVMKAMKNVDRRAFIVDQHDFSLAAKNAIGFAFRQHVTERHSGLGHRWERVVAVYCLGHWPVGYAGDKLIVV
ncbi:hypothetical protein [Pseudomonas sp. Leaf127]|uniref:hypothetical protein n=1 Tax=Pseudomonas sp. Leaf127 TaxID=1736267 RepID=UPI000B2CD035|nr:hypothetical protein [Pseudomonas sp. Leaf127]